MPRNYDTTGHKPYPRITQVEINYTQDGTATVNYVEQAAIVDGDGHVQHIGSAATRYQLSLSSIEEPVQLVHPATGLPIPGQTVTSHSLMLGLLAFLRADQVRRDAENDANSISQDPAE